MEKGRYGNPRGKRTFSTEMVDDIGRSAHGIKNIIRLLNQLLKFRYCGPSGLHKSFQLISLGPLAKGKINGLGNEAEIGSPGNILRRNQGEQGYLHPQSGQFFSHPGDVPITAGGQAQAVSDKSNFHNLMVQGSRFKVISKSIMSAPSVFSLRSSVLHFRYFLKHL